MNITLEHLDKLKISLISIEEQMSELMPGYTTKQLYSGWRARSLIPRKEIGEGATAMEAVEALLKKLEIL